MLGASCFFYGWWDERFVVLLAGSILANHHLGDWVGDAMGPDGNPTPRSKALVRVGVVGTLATPSRRPLRRGAKPATS